MGNLILNNFKTYLVEKKAVADNTLESYGRDVSRYLEYLEQESIDLYAADTAVVEGFVGELKAANKSAATITRTVASIRALYQYLMQIGAIERNPAKNIKLEKAEKKLPEILNDKEIRLLLSMPNAGEPKGARDKAMLEVLYSTGIKVADINHRPNVTIGTDGYYYLDNVKSTLKVTTNLYSNTTPNSTSPLPTLGLATIIKNGYYYMPGVYYNSTYNSFAIRGGASSIGIETCVNDGSDLIKTWHYTAKFTAKLLVKYNLTPDRVLFHNNFANKQCPNTMINADLVDYFLKMVYI